MFATEGMQIFPAQASSTSDDSWTEAASTIFLHLSSLEATSLIVFSLSF